MTGEPATDPTWQPVPPPVVRGHVRPKAATSFKAARVVAYRQCVQSNENRSHGPPLGFPSCAPPGQSSGFLTVGPPDSNGMPAKSWGAVQLDVIAGNPATPADEADVAVVAVVTDVRLAGSLADYAGEIGVRLPIRIVDKNNSGPGPGVTVDSALNLPVSCAPTSDTTVGSSCATYTTVDAVIPGAIAERQRATWQLGEVQVFDGGPMGTRTRSSTRCS